MTPEKRVAERLCILQHAVERSSRDEERMENLVGILCRQIPPAVP